ncbi:MAG TPA: NUDIX domain-containing protein [Acidobacteriaceae bacterium]|nr:NUDIX domain-containing protein [Acidobacteriaceae bacterium]
MKMRNRRTARVLVFDEVGRVLLIRCAMVLKSGEDFVFWVTPGGEIEPGEEPGEAAVRELREELGLELAVRGPLYTETNEFELAGEMRANVDHWFVARCAADAPRMKGVTAEELAMMQEMRWWSAGEVEQALAAGERIFPVDLAERMREFGEIQA